MVLAAPLAYAQPPAGSSHLDWYGYLYLNGPDNTVGTGGTCLALMNTVQALPCFPLDFVNYEYSVVIDNMTISSVTPLAGGSYRTLWIGGSLRVYEDPAKNAAWGVNPPNATAPSTFVDGTLILIGGPFVGTLVRYRYANGSGVFQGDFDWTGGRDVALLPRCTVNSWRCWGGLSGVTPTLPAGYREAWDGQFWCNVPVPLVPETWGSIKSIYR
jgi:hypothetical protein